MIRSDQIILTRVPVEKICLGNFFWSFGGSRLLLTEGDHQSISYDELRGYGCDGNTGNDTGFTTEGLSRNLM
jgi:hypothetical protein